MYGLQVSLVPPAPVLPPGVTTPVEVRFRPLLVGSTEAVLRLDSAELGLYEWKLKLTGAPTIPEKPLTYSVPLGNREVQVSWQLILPYALAALFHVSLSIASHSATFSVGVTSLAEFSHVGGCRGALPYRHGLADYLSIWLLQVLRFTHWLQEKAEYKCSFKSSSSGSAAGAPAGVGGVAASSTGFDAPLSVAAPPAGPNGADVECVVGFEPCALGEAVRDVLLLTSPSAGVFEVPLMGQCVPPKPQGPIDVSKVRGRGCWRCASQDWHRNAAQPLCVSNMCLNECLSSFVLSPCRVLRWCRSGTCLLWRLSSSTARTTPHSWWLGPVRSCRPRSLAASVSATSPLLLWAAGRPS